MKERLECTKCNKKWSREKTRGRKPTLCPKCSKLAAATKVAPRQPKATTLKSQTTLKKNKFLTVGSTAQDSPDNTDSSSDLTVGKVYNYFHPQPSNSEELMEQTKGGSKWQCTKCRYEFKMYLPVSATPTHKCSSHGQSHPCKRID